MRRLLLALMILLLPLRGWMGDAMAMQAMAHHEATVKSATVLIAKEYRQYSRNASFSHPNHAQSSLDAPLDGHAAGHPDGDGHEQHGHAACNACDMCHSSAMAVSALNWLPRPEALSLPQGCTPSDTSAERAVGQKPPIS